MQFPELIAEDYGCQYAVPGTHPVPNLAMANIDQVLSEHVCYLLVHMRTASKPPLHHLRGHCRMTIPSFFDGCRYYFVAFLLLLLLLGCRSCWAPNLLLFAIWVIFIKLKADPFAFVLTAFGFLILLYFDCITLMEWALRGTHIMNLKPIVKHLLYANPILLL